MPAGEGHIKPAIKHSCQKCHHLQVAILAESQCKDSSGQLLFIELLLSISVEEVEHLLNQFQLQLTSQHQYGQN